MQFGCVSAFTIGLISTSLIISVRGAHSGGFFHGQCVPPLKDPGYVFGSHKTSADVISNGVTPLYCNGASKFMNIELSEEFKNMREDFSNGWNYYETVDSGEEWDTPNISYYVRSYGDYPREKVDKLLKAAFSKWSAAAPQLKFTQVNNIGNAQLKLDIARSSSADGRLPHLTCTLHPGKEHATLHLVGNKIESPSSKDENGYHYDSMSMNAMLCAVTHAFGHVLGLRHSADPDAIMSNRVRCWGRQDVELDRDDIKGIQKLYPEKGGSRKARKNSSDSSSGSESKDETDSEEEDEDEPTKDEEDEPTEDEEPTLTEEEQVELLRNKLRSIGGQVKNWFSNKEGKKNR